MITAVEFAEIKAEYDAAREALAEAEERRQRAGQALMAAQCRVQYDRTGSLTGGYVLHFCTLPAGHFGDHGKYGS